MNKPDDGASRRCLLDRLLEKLANGPTDALEAQVNPLDLLDLICAGLVQWNEDKGTISLTAEGHCRIGSRRRATSDNHADEAHYPFTPGDPVRLKSGGPLMTVLSVDLRGAVTCIWSNSTSGNYENEYDTFSSDALEHDG